MKKSLLMILGAALLMVGCSKELETKVDDLSSRLDALEAQVKANKAAIDELKNADFITAVEETATGWVITLSNGKKLNLYNGKDGANGADGQPGADGDSFFSSVVVEGDYVVITLTDGTKITIPFVAEFALQLALNDVVVEPSATVRIKYEIVGQTEKTTVNVIASGNYVANIEGDEVVILCPDVLQAGRMLVYADNGLGSTSIKTIDVDGQKVSVDKTDVAGPFWGGSATFTVASNVEETVEVDPADRSWLSVERTKAVVNKEYTAKMASTPYMDARKGTIYVKDPAGKVIQTINVTQNGTGFPIFIEAESKQFGTFAEAIAYGETLEAKDIRLSIAQSLLNPFTTEDICVIPAGTKKNWVITKRSIGNADPSQCIFGGLRVEGDSWVNCYDCAIRPTGLVPHSGGVQFNNYPYGILVTNATTDACHVTATNVGFHVIEALKTAQGTLVAVDADSKAEVNLNSLYGNAGGCRYAQIYGGNVTFRGCEIANSYSYAVRIGQKGTKCTLTGNMVDNPTFVDLHSTLADATVTFGDGVTDDNHYSKNVTLVAKGTPAGTVTVLPASVVGAAPVEGSAKVFLNDYGFNTIQEAVDASKVGDHILVTEGEYPEVVRIYSWKDLTIEGADQYKTVIAGGIEIAGGATIKNLTVKSKPGVTTNELKVSISGDAYTWGHYFLTRIENGATKVALEKVIFDATDETDSNFPGTMSMLWISQAQEVTVSGCTFNTTANGSYCPNQTHQAKVLFENNVFNGGGKKGWALRAMDTDLMTVSGNEFHSKYAVDVYEDFKGTLTLGDGVNDNNIYGSEVEEALHGNKDAALTAGSVFLPEDVAFGKPTTAEGAVFKAVWTVQSLEAGIPESRNITFDGTNVICSGNAKPWWTPATIVAVRGGQVVSTLAWNSEWVNGFTGAVTGLTTVQDNGATCVLACNVAAEGNKWAATNSEFNVYKYTGLDKVEKVVSLTREGADNKRMGDYLSFRGTWQDGAILVCEANNNAPRVYEFAVKDGKVADAPVTYLIDEETRGKKGGIAGVFHVKDNQYIITNEGAGAIVVTLEGGEAKYVANLDFSAFGVGNILRTPKFFSLNGKEYMAAIIGTYEGTQLVGTANLIVIEITNGDLLASIAAATPENSHVKVIENCAAGNGFAGLDVLAQGETVYIGYGVMNGEVGLIKFRNQ